jgi:hypothetical protein
MQFEIIQKKIAFERKLSNYDCNYFIDNCIFAD